MASRPRGEQFWVVSGPHSTPARLPRVCGMTWQFATRHEAFDQRGESIEAIRTCAPLSTLAEVRDRAAGVRSGRVAIGAAPYVSPVSAH